MKEADFYNLVQRMRQAQRAYFATRRTQYKDLAIKLEQQVDQAIITYLNSTIYPTLPFN